MHKIYGRKDNSIMFYDGNSFTANRGDAKCYLLTQSVLEDWLKLKVSHPEIKELNWV